MTPGHRDLTIKQGQTFRENVVLRLSDTTAYDLSSAGDHGQGTATAQVRDAAGGTLIVDLECTIPVGTDGTIQLFIDAEDTADLDFDLGVWDLFVTFEDGERWCLLEGEASLSRAVTVAVDP